MLTRTGISPIQVDKPNIIKHQKFPRVLSWYILQLSQWGENQEVDVIKSSIRKTLGECDIFIPIYYENDDDYKTKVYAVEGYVFISEVGNEEKCYQFRYNPYFEGPVLNPDGSLAEVQDEFVVCLKNELLKSITSKVNVGDTVLVIDGIHKDFVGTVTKVNKTDYTVNLSVVLESVKLSVDGVPMSSISVEK